MNKLIEIKKNVIFNVIIILVFTNINVVNSIHLDNEIWGVKVDDELYYRMETFEIDGFIDEKPSFKYYFNFIDFGEYNYSNQICFAENFVWTIIIGQFNGSNVYGNVTFPDNIDMNTFGCFNRPTFKSTHVPLLDYFVVQKQSSQHWNSLIHSYAEEFEVNSSVYQTFNVSYNNNIFEVKYSFYEPTEIDTWYYNPQHTKGLKSWNYKVDTVRGIVTEFEAIYGNNIRVGADPPKYLHYKYILTERLEEYVEPTPTEESYYEGPILFGQPIPFGNFFLSLTGLFLLTMILVVKRRKKDNL